MVKKKQRLVALDFEIDKLTNSIENVVTGESFATQVTLASKADLKTITKKAGWLFNWAYEFKQPEREVYKLTTLNNPSIIHGLISVEDRLDHIYMHLIENAPFNLGKAKMYAGVAGNLVAFACQLSFRKGYEGNLSFISKTKLVEHYIKTLDATHIRQGLMFIETKAAQNLVDKYFKI